MDKFSLNDGVLKHINDFGIYEYFSKKSLNQVKLIAVAYDDKYVINAKEKSEHYGLCMEISQCFGPFSNYVGSIGDELNLFIMKPLSEEEIYIFTEVYNELKNYYLQTNNNKEIRIFDGIYGLFDGIDSCKDIDKLILVLKNIKADLKSINNEKINEVYGK